jgi:hypothetical protein
MRHVLPALVSALAIACAPTGSATSPTATPVPATVFADGGPTSFETRLRAEIEALGVPSSLYLGREQRRFEPPIDLQSLTVPATLPRARMFAYDFADEAYGACGDRIAGRDGTLCSSAVAPGSRLSPAQTTLAAAILRDAPRTFSQRARVSCFEPHHAVVFFGEDDRPVAEITICFTCGNFHLAPGPAEEASMSDAEAMFFANLCRELGVGACPATGKAILPDLPPEAATSLSPAEARRARVERALSRPMGVDPQRRVSALSPAEKRLACAWLQSAVHLIGSGIPCADGRTLVAEEPSECVAGPARTCRATIADLTACARSRLQPLCGADAPSCARSDSCRWGFSRAEP